MIDKCFKCDGAGKISYEELARESGCPGSGGAASYCNGMMIQCPRCLGAGALNYEIVKYKQVSTKSRRTKWKNKTKQENSLRRRSSQPDQP